MAAGRGRWRSCAGALALAALLAGPARGLPQPESPLRLGLSAQEGQALEEIALLPAPQRSAVLEVASHSEALWRIEGLERDFDARLEPILFGRPPSVQAQLRAIARSPQETRGGAYEVAREHPEERARIEALREGLALGIDRVIARYRSETRDAFHEVLSRPELRDLLVANPQLVASLGAAWRLDPGRAQEELGEIQYQVEQARAEAAAREQARRQVDADRAAEKQARKEARQRWGTWNRWGYRDGWGYGGPWNRGYRWGTWGYGPVYYFGSGSGPWYPYYRRGGSAGAGGCEGL